MVILNTKFFAFTGPAGPIGGGPTNPLYRPQKAATSKLNDKTTEDLEEDIEIQMRKRFPKSFEGEE